VSLIGVFGRTAALVLVALVSAAVANAISPRGIAWTGTAAFAVGSRAAEEGLRVVTLEEVRRLLEEGTWVVLDARSPERYEEGHLPGALSMPVKRAAEVFAELQILLTPDQPVAVYCSGKSCDESLQLGRFLKEQGIKDVAVFEGGMEAWQAAKLELERGL
jgi:rhodanese-related sulfurtransferase